MQLLLAHRLKLAAKQRTQYLQVQQVVLGNQCQYRADGITQQACLNLLGGWPAVAGWPELVGDALLLQQLFDQIGQGGGVLLWGRLAIHELFLALTTVCLFQRSSLACELGLTA